MAVCWIALGGNQGDVAHGFDVACRHLALSGVSVLRRSANFTTSPVGADAGARFLNAVAELETELGPSELLLLLQFVEQLLGRERTRRWGPRTLDLDLLFYGADQVQTPALIVPHPHLWYRRFVLDPLVSVAPELIHPVIGVPVLALQQGLLSRPLSCALTGGDEATRSELAAVLNESGETRLAEASEAWLNLWCGESVGLAQRTPRGLPWIRLVDFPTPAAQTCRDVLMSALSPARRIDG